MFLFAYPASPLSSGLNVDDLRQRTIKFFGPGTEYDTPLNNPYREKGGMVTSILNIFFAKDRFIIYCGLEMFKSDAKMNGNC